jgi:F-type H+-transporting ATPase subunit delta
MPLSAVATRYANALADVVTAAGSSVHPQDVVSELRAFETALQSPELHNALVTPAIPSNRKKAVVGRIADILKLSRVTRNFLFVLIDHRRIAGFPEIVNTLETVLDERLGFARAEVTSAQELKDAERQALNQVLERVSGKRIRIAFDVDPALIGGVVARIGSTVYDGSLRGQLLTLGRRLAAEA